MEKARVLRIGTSVGNNTIAYIKIHVNRSVTIEAASFISSGKKILSYKQLVLHTDFIHKSVNYTLTLMM